MNKHIFHEVAEYPDINKLIKDSLLFTFEKTEDIINAIFHGFKILHKSDSIKKDSKHYVKNHERHIYTH